MGKTVIPAKPYKFGTGVTISKSTNYTCPSDGMIRLTADLNRYTTLTVDGVLVSQFYGAGISYTIKGIPVRAHQVVQWSSDSGGSAIFYPYIIKSN